MNFIPRLFNHSERPEVNIRDLSIESDSQWIEFIMHLSRLDLTELPETKEHLDLLLKENQTPSKRAVLYAGLGRYYKGRGNLQEAVKVLGYAFSLISNNRNCKEVRAFLTIEMAIMLSVTGNIDLSQMMLERVPQYTRSEYLLRSANYRSLENRMRRGDLDLIDDLQTSMKYFIDIKQPFTVAYHYKTLGNLYRRINDYEQSRAYYNAGLKIAEQNSYFHIKASLMHDLALLKFHMGDNDGSINDFKQVIEISSNYYVKCVSLANMGYVYSKIRSFGKATSAFQKALNIASEHGIYHQVAGLCFYLGESYEEQEQLDLAEYFYKRGYDSAIDMMNNHFPPRGDILHAIRGYTRFMEEHKENSFIPTRPSDMNLDFSLNKPLKEIRSVFQKAVLETMITYTGSKRNAARKLGIAERSLFSILERVNHIEEEEIPEEIMRFISRNLTLPWKELNKKYESDVLSFLYHKYGRNKRVMSEKLDVSYPNILNLTAHISRNAFPGENIKKLN